MENFNIVFWQAEVQVFNLFFWTNLLTGIMNFIKVFTLNL